MSASESQITHLLKAWSDGDTNARDQLIPLVIDELKAIAQRQLARETPGHTLQPTALVNELYMRLHAQHEADWNDRNKFFAVAGKIVRQILVDHARKRQAKKRGRDGIRVTFEEWLDLGRHRDPDLVVLDDALKALEQADPRGAHVVELRIFSGMKHNEIAAHLGISRTTVTREWTHAKLWLQRELKRR